MLLQFSVTNHRSIHGNAILSLAATFDREFQGSLLTPDGKKKILPVAAIYGANAAGKSNVLHALDLMRSIPIGVLGAMVWNGQVKMWGLTTLLYGIGLSTVIELMQLVGHRGLFEFDDIFDNGIGTVVGVLLYFVMRWIVEMALPPYDDDLKTI